MGVELHGSAEGGKHSVARNSVLCAPRSATSFCSSRLSQISTGIALILGIALSHGSISAPAIAADTAHAETASAAATPAYSTPAPADSAQAAAETSTAGILTLRGALLPAENSSNRTDTTRPVRLASLGNSAIAHDASAGILPRLNFSSFRYSFEPARGQKKKSTRRSRRGKSNAGHVKLTSLDHSFVPNGKSYRKQLRKVARGSIKWLAYPGCVPKGLKRVLVKLSRKFGGLTVNSTHRSHRYNRKIGGAKHSYHLSCQAVDFRLGGRYRSALAYLKKLPQVGGLKHYGNGVFHIDIGPRRTW